MSGTKLELVVILTVIQRSISQDKESSCQCDETDYRAATIFFGLLSAMLSIIILGSFSLVFIVHRRIRCLKLKLQHIIQQRGKCVTTNTLREASDEIVQQEMDGEKEYESMSFHEENEVSTEGNEGVQKEHESLSLCEENEVSAEGDEGAQEDQDYVMISVSEVKKVSVSNHPEMELKTEHNEAYGVLPIIPS